MLMDRKALLERIRLGEDSLLELKEVRLHRGRLQGPTQEDLANELAAFANSAGGTLVLGVKDAPREIIGIPLDRLDEMERIVQQACEQSIRPPLAPLIERMLLPDASGAEQAVIRVEVSRSLFVHQSPGGYLHRVGSSKREMAPDFLARLFQQRSQSRLIRFDETPVPRASMGDLDEALWRRFAPEESADQPEILLHKLGMADRDEMGHWRPTVAGILMACRQPQRFLPGAFIQAVAYRGSEIVANTSGLYQIDAKDLTGPLDQQIMDACAFVLKNMKVGAIKHLTGGREDIPQFDILSVFEAVTNAVAHRDYSIPGAKVRLRLFHDRLEIFSPGMLPNTMTPASMPFRQAARNEALTSLLARCPITDTALLSHRRRIMDKRGEGVPIILSRTEALSGQRPVYQIHDDSEVMLMLPAANEGRPMA
ncbi:MAG: ATP-binding protein [Lautropia sp.]|nr:ATP-binding protein [Lautropia sp.]